LKRRTAVALDLRQGRVGATQDDDVNTWHRWLALIPVKLLDNFSSTVWRRDDGGGARLGLGFGGGGTRDG
jgi:hypothetical protein